MSKNSKPIISKERSPLDNENYKIKISQARMINLFRDEYKENLKKLLDLLEIKFSLHGKNQQIENLPWHNKFLIKLGIGINDFTNFFDKILPSFKSIESFTKNYNYIINENKKILFLLIENISEKYPEHSQTSHFPALQDHVKNVFKGFETLRLSNKEDFNNNIIPELIKNQTPIPYLTTKLDKRQIILNNAFNSFLKIIYFIDFSERTNFLSAYLKNNKNKFTEKTISCIYLYIINLYKKIYLNNPNVKTFFSLEYLADLLPFNIKLKLILNLSCFSYRPFEKYSEENIKKIRPNIEPTSEITLLIKHHQKLNNFSTKSQKTFLLNFLTKNKRILLLQSKENKDFPYNLIIELLNSCHSLHLLHPKIKNILEQCFDKKIELSEFHFSHLPTLLKLSQTNASNTLFFHDNRALNLSIENLIKTYLDSLSPSSQLEEKPLEKFITDLLNLSNSVSIAKSTSKQSNFSEEPFDIFFNKTNSTSDISYHSSPKNQCRLRKIRLIVLKNFLKYINEKHSLTDTNTSENPAYNYFNKKKEVIFEYFYSLFGETKFKLPPERRASENTHLYCFNSENFMENYLKKSISYNDDELLEFIKSFFIDVQCCIYADKNDLKQTHVFLTIFCIWLKSFISSASELECLESRQETRLCLTEDVNKEIIPRVLKSLESKDNLLVKIISSVSETNRYSKETFSGTPKRIESNYPVIYKDKMEMEMEISLINEIASGLRDKKLNGYYCEIHLIEIMPALSEIFKHLALINKNIIIGKSLDLSHVKLNILTCLKTLFFTTHEIKVFLEKNKSVISSVEKNTGPDNFFYKIFLVILIVILNKNEHGGLLYSEIYTILKSCLPTETTDLEFYCKHLPEILKSKLPNLESKISFSSLMIKRLMEEYKITQIPYKNNHSSIKKFAYTFSMLSLSTFITTADSTSPMTLEKMIGSLLKNYLVDKTDSWVAFFIDKLKLSILEEYLGALKKYSTATENEKEIEYLIYSYFNENKSLIFRCLEFALKNKLSNSHFTNSNCNKEPEIKFIVTSFIKIWNTLYTTERYSLIVSAFTKSLYMWLNTFTSANAIEDSLKSLKSDILTYCQAHEINFIFNAESKNVAIANAALSKARKNKIKLNILTINEIASGLEGSKTKAYYTKISIFDVQSIMLEFLEEKELPDKVNELNELFEEINTTVSQIESNFEICLKNLPLSSESTASEKSNNLFLSQKTRIETQLETLKEKISSLKGGKQLSLNKITNSATCHSGQHVLFPKPPEGDDDNHHPDSDHSLGITTNDNAFHNRAFR